MLSLLAAVLLSSNLYELDRFDGHIEHGTPDPRVAQKVETLLEQNRLDDLRNLVVSGDIKTRRTAAIEALFSKHRDALQIVLLLAGEEDKQLRDIAFDAVTRHPRECWPILLQMARQGDAGATKLISRYVNLLDKVALELVDSPHAEIRAWSVGHLPVKPYAERALSDPDIRVCRAAVAKISRLDPPQHPRFLFHSNVRLRILAAEMAFYGHVEEDYAKWTRAAYDTDPTVRYWALHHFITLASKEAPSGQRSEVIRAVRNGLVSGPPIVRRAATYAVRGWLLRWDEALTTWSRREIEAARSILRLRVLHDELLRQSSSEETRSGSHSLLANGIAIADPLKAMALAGDDRAAKAITKRIAEGKTAVHHHWLVDWYAYTHAHFARPELWELIRVGVGKSTFASVNRSDDAEVLLDKALIQLLRIVDRQDFDRLVALISDESIAGLRRVRLLKAIAWSGDPRTATATRDFAQDDSLDAEVRYEAIRLLSQIPSGNSRETLEFLIANPDDEIRKRAERALIKWNEKYLGD